MPPKVLDFRSDTVTRPTPAMRAAMAQAEVGDDVLGDDPTVLALQQRVAEILGKQDAVFLPSGTMSNLIGVMVHCGRGDEFLCEAGCHIFNYEQSGYAQIGGIAARAVPAVRGILEVRQLEGLVRPENDHQARTRLLCVENTHNRCGGSITPLDAIGALTGWAREAGLACHLDGARIWNVEAATKIGVKNWADPFDTVSVCFSKGLGAPVGSALAGPTSLIKKARRLRKALGGGMRQSGVLAAAALHALEFHRDRLIEDHQAAQALAEILETNAKIRVEAPVETNIVIFTLVDTAMNAAELVGELSKHGVFMLAIAPKQVRAVTHLDVTLDDARKTGTIVKELLG